MNSQQELAKGHFWREDTELLKEMETLKGKKPSQIWHGELHWNSQPKCEREAERLRRYKVYHASSWRPSRRNGEARFKEIKAMHFLKTWETWIRRPRKQHISSRIHKEETRGYAHCKKAAEHQWRRSSKTSREKTDHWHMSRVHSLW